MSTVTVEYGTFESKLSKGEGSNRQYAVAWIDTPNSAKPNILDEPCLRSAEKAFAELQSRLGDDTNAIVVVASRKEGSFVVGADVHTQLALTNATEIAGMVDELKAIYQALEDLPQTTVCLINGPCLGGGLELALCCDYRVADTGITKNVIGLPEIKVGVLPGAGGTVRLPRLIGTLNAVDLISRGALVSARRARSLGIVDWCDDTGSGLSFQTQSQVAQWIADNEHRLRRGTNKYTRHHNAIANWLTTTWVFRQLIYTVSRRAIYGVSQRLLPSPYVALSSVLTGAGLSYRDAFANESRGYVTLCVSPEMKSLAGLFVMAKDIEKRSLGYGNSTETDSEESKSDKGISSIAIIGAGYMGAGIAQGLLYGGHRVLLIDVAQSALDGAQSRIAELFKPLVQKRRMSAESVTEILESQVIYSTQLQSSIREFAPDMVLECIAENVTLKQKVWCEIESSAPATTLLATNTSSIPIREIVRDMRDVNGKRVVGYHYFHPERNVTPGIEIVRTPRVTDDTAVGRAAAFAKKCGKTPVVVTDALPGFCVNRISAAVCGAIFHLMTNCADVTPQRIIRVIQKRMHWRRMNPFMMIDRLGLHIASKVAALINNSSAEMTSYQRVLSRLLEAGATGRHPITKTGSGFYTYDKNTKWNPLATEFIDDERMTTSTSDTGCISDADIADTVLLSIVSEAARLVEERVVANADDLDLLLVIALGWPPHTGGPLYHATRVFKSEAGIDARRRELVDKVLPKGASAYLSASLAVPNSPRPLTAPPAADGNSLVTPYDSGLLPGGGKTAWIAAALTACCITAAITLRYKH